MTRSPSGERGLHDTILERIEREGPISFADFQSLVCHDPDAGYYAAGPRRVGVSGDFITSPEVSAEFGRCIAVQIAEMDELLQARVPTLVEIGGGSGRLMADVLSALLEAGCGATRRLSVVMVESSPAMRRAQEKRLSRFGGDARIAWAGDVSGAAELSGGSIEGIVFSNEFFDALPVHVVERRDGRLMERRVTMNAGRLDSAVLPVASPELAAYSDRYAVATEEGSVAEIGLDAVRQVRSIGRHLERGFHIAIDYGHEAAELYSGRHSAGTLLAYSKHRTGEGFFDHLGEQDITAHVNFSALIDSARDVGMMTAGLTTQDRFLLATGLADRISELGGAGSPEDIRRRLAMTTLLHPSGMGRTFKVLVQYRGIESPRLRGLNDPFARSSVTTARTGAGAVPPSDR